MEKRKSWPFAWLFIIWRKLYKNEKCDRSNKNKIHENRVRNRWKHSGRFKLIRGLSKNISFTWKWAPRRNRRAFHFRDLSLFWSRDNMSRHWKSTSCSVWLRPIFGHCSKEHWTRTIAIKLNDWWWLQINDTKSQWKTNDILLQHPPLFQNESTPLYTFLTVGAGVWKNVLPRSLYEALIKLFNDRVGKNPDYIKILLCVLTAHNIEGSTIHSAFGIPVGRWFAFKPLDIHQLDSIRCMYFQLKVVLIDEISTVGAEMFNFINSRLQE